MRRIWGTRAGGRPCGWSASCSARSPLCRNLIGGVYRVTARCTTEAALRRFGSRGPAGRRGVGVVQFVQELGRPLRLGRRVEHRARLVSE